MNVIQLQPSPQHVYSLVTASVSNMAYSQISVHVLSIEEWIKVFAYSIL